MEEKFNQDNVEDLINNLDETNLNNPFNENTDFLGSNLLNRDEFSAFVNDNEISKVTKDNFLEHKKDLLDCTGKNEENNLFKNNQITNDNSFLSLLKDDNTVENLLNNDFDTDISSLLEKHKSESKERTFSSKLDYDRGSDELNRIAERERYYAEQDRRNVEVERERQRERQAYEERQKVERQRQEQAEEQRKVQERQEQMRKEEQRKEQERREEQRKELERQNAERQKQKDREFKELEKDRNRRDFNNRRNMKQRRMHQNPTILLITLLGM